MSDRLNFIELHARTVLGMPPKWRISSWECHPFGSPTEFHPKDTFEVWGAVYPMKTRGKNAGTPQWKRPAPGTRRAAFFTTADHRAFLRNWEIETGKCHCRQGSGQEWYGWGATTGDRFRACTRCGATGHAPESEVA